MQLTIKGLKHVEYRTSDEICEICGRNLIYMKPSDHIGWLKRDCECIKAKRKAEIKQGDINARDYIRESSGIPKKYSDKTFDNYTPRNDDEKKLKQLAFEFAGKNYYNTGKWLVMLGGVGVGKTHISIAIMNKTIDSMDIAEYIAERFIHGYDTNITPPCRYIRCTDLIEGEKDRMKDNSATNYEAICKNTPLLVLDDFGVTSATDWNKDLFYRVLDHRYINDLPTVLSTNLGIEELKKATGTRIYDRLREMCKAPVAVNSKSYRPTVATVTKEKA